MSALALTAESRRAASTSARGPGDLGHGRRLILAFEALDAFPALAESRRRVLRLVGEPSPSPVELVAAVESDPALAVTVLRLANRAHARAETVVKAVEVLGPQTVGVLASRLRTYDFFQRAGVWERTPERFRLHAVAVQRAAGRLAGELRYEPRDRLMVTALLHDIGKLVLVHAYPAYPDEVHRGARTPEERLRRERTELGVDHALVGGVLARRWALPKAIASGIERHHSDDADGEAAIIRLADMLAHYDHGQTVTASTLAQAARRVGLPIERLRAVLYDLPNPPAPRRRALEPSPLSSREADVLRQLAGGKVYKEIATALGLSTSTVRTHLHNVYGKLGAVDRAQAVLVATERGWL